MSSPDETCSSENVADVDEDADAYGEACQDSAAGDVDGRAQPRSGLVVAKILKARGTGSAPHSRPGTSPSMQGGYTRDGTLPPLRDGVTTRTAAISDKAVALLRPRLETVCDASAAAVEDLHLAISARERTGVATRTAQAAARKATRVAASRLAGHEAARAAADLANANERAAVGRVERAVALVADARAAHARARSEAALQAQISHEVGRQVAGLPTEVRAEAVRRAGWIAADALSAEQAAIAVIVERTRDEVSARLGRLEASEHARRSAELATAAAAAAETADRYARATGAAAIHAGRVVQAAATRIVRQAQTRLTDAVIEEEACRTELAKAGL
jgi:hypothetical protein